MAILHRELLSLDDSDGLLLVTAETLVKAMDDEPFGVGRPPPDQAIECLREANICFPDSERVSLTLLISLCLRFVVTRSHADYEVAMSIVDRSLTDPMPPYAKRVLNIAVMLARFRSYFYGKPEYLEEAIFHIRFHLRVTSSEDLLRQDMTRDLEELEENRLDQFSVASSSRAAHAGNTEVNNHSSPSHLVSPLPNTGSDMGELTLMTWTQDAAFRGKQPI